VRRRAARESERYVLLMAGSYFNSFGERLEPWMAVWHVVQFRQRGVRRLWVATGCEPRAPEASGE
jgi:hypothetical protein